MKKLALFLALALVLATGFTAAMAAPQPFKVGVATIFEGETWEIQKSYYEKELAPTLNMEFIFSERLTDANGLVDFMDRAYAAGCVGIINFVTSNDAVAQGAHKAEEFDMYFITQSSRLNKDVADIPNNLGHVGASATGMGTAYEKLFNALLQDGENHSVFMATAVAPGGNTGTGAASHFHSTYGMLTAMQKKYDLKFDKTLDEIIDRQEPGRVETGNENIRIYLAPGLDAAPVTTALQTQMQTGEYDIFATVYQYASYANVLADLEKSLNKDLAVIGTMAIEAQTGKGFETKDSFGSSILNAAVVNPLNNANGICAAILYNALTGHAEAMKDNGQAVLFKVEPWVVMGAETYQGLSKLDQSRETYVLGEEDLKALTVEQDASVTFRTFEKKLVELADVDALIAKKIK